MSGVEREPVSIVKSRQTVEEMLEGLPKKTGDIRKKHVVVKDSCDIEQHIEANDRSIPGILTNRGCAYFTWGTRRNLMSAEEGRDCYAGYCLCTDVKETDIVFGAEKKLATAIREAYAIFKPECISIFCTCPIGLIGDYIESVCKKAEEDLRIKVVPVRCEGYRGVSQSAGHHIASNALMEHLVGTEELENPGPYDVNVFGEYNICGDYWVVKDLLERVGYRVALKGLVQTLARRTDPNGRINILVGSIISPADVRYLKRLLDDWGLGYILLPDISETFDSPLCEDLPRIPAGGTPLDDIRDSANSKATVIIGGLVQKPGAGDFLEKEFGVPHRTLSLPIGLEFSDRLAACLEELTGKAMPECYERERGRLLDTMVDAHKIVAEARTAVFGDTETVLGLTKLMTELGMRPQIIATGANNSAFTEYVAQIAPGSRIMTKADYSEIAQEISNGDIDMMVGPFTGRQTARREAVPLLRVGLPNHDRFGASHQRLLGYEGSMHLVESLANALIESREEGSA